MKEKMVEWLQLGRAQTFPADWLLVIVPFAHGQPDLFPVLLLTVFMWFVHFVSFAENSLFDFTQGYDTTDPAKSTHPLEQGRITVHNAITGIVWGKGFLMVVGAALTIAWSPVPLWSMVGLFMWYTWGTAYNVGLSKESLLGFLPISVCFTSMGAWAWLLSHSELGVVGAVYLAFVFFTILFQISYSGHLKDLEQKEHSNILTKMGANIHKFGKGKWYYPGKARHYGLAIKSVNIFLALTLFLFSGVSDALGIVVGFLAVMASIYLWKLTKPRYYERAEELKNMGMEEIATIFLVLPSLVGVISLPLMLVAAAYYFAMNKVLWKASYPRV